ncbi:MAG: hypothetical protein J7K17_06720 [Candidatus Omnitrophica bacterium]|nr:hypothetical protein [Candidatus Omnitrophota bacterium]
MLKGNKRLNKLFLKYLLKQSKPIIEIIIGKIKTGYEGQKEAQALLKLRILSAKDESASDREQNKEDWDSFFKELKWN